MLPYEIITKKRNGQTLTPDELRFFITGFLSNQIPDYQMAAFLMAVYFRGMTVEETATLTETMINTGIRLKPGPGKKTADKHSTGGVGDKVSLPLTPLLASCGLAVPMISGRGLGHTGGTLDKLESIPGFRTDLTEEEFLEQIDSIGMALAAQTEKIVPADKRMYALRDVTATVDSIPLIASSIMSKKIAEGVHNLILDVKTGCGAFMSEQSEAEKLARAMVALGTASELNVQAVVTDMNQPLGSAIGNAVEMNESVELLRGNSPDDLKTLTCYLAGQLLIMADVVTNHEEADALFEQKISSGEAMECFLTLVRAQGGDVSVFEGKKLLPIASEKISITSESSGYLEALDPVSLGYAVTMLGGGRQKSDDVIDHQVGLFVHAKIGDHVEHGFPLIDVCYNKRDKLEKALPYIKRSIKISNNHIEKPILIKRLIV